MGVDTECKKGEKGKTPSGKRVPFTLMVKHQNTTKGRPNEEGTQEQGNKDVAGSQGCA